MTRLYLSPISFGEVEQIGAEFSGGGSVLLERGKNAEISREIHWYKSPEAPICKGDPLGTLVIRCGETELGRVEIVAAADVRRLSIGMVFARLLASFRWF